MLLLLALPSASIIRISSPILAVPGNVTVLAPVRVLINSLSPAEALLEAAGADHVLTTRLFVLCTNDATLS